MMMMPRLRSIHRSIHAFAIQAYISTCIPFATSQHYPDCDAISYYSAITHLTNHNQLHSQIQNTHRTSLPYSSISSSNDNMWDALASLDSDNSGDNLLLVTETNMSLSLRGMEGPANIGIENTCGRAVTAWGGGSYKQMHIGMYGIGLYGTPYW